jgi:hypothetical protein
MKLLDFMAKLHEEIQKMVFPRCTMLEQIGAGIVLGAVDFRVGQLVSENSELVKKLGLIDEAGEVNIDCVEHAIINGVQWPQKIGPFTFSSDDAKLIMRGVRGRVS